MEIVQPNDIPSIPTMAPGLVLQYRPMELFVPTPTLSADGCPNTARSNVMAFMSADKRNQRSSSNVDGGVVDLFSLVSMES